ncbi:Trehalose/maltose import ATP-binding protein MalK [Geodia barretti]|nr:Trehalose/maltose import ATP-binding protein MalK [Geodia barretti]
MVFQSYGIWPHMDVFENIAFPLRRGRLKMERDAVRVRVGEVLEMLGLDALAERPVITLSGGQQQRVALARALALQPRILLMDEPLSNLDFKLQVRLRAQMRDLMHRLGLTTIHVTHNQAEALETGDRIAVMAEGRIVQIGDPQAAYHRPENEFVARFIGDMNIFPAVYRGSDAGMARVETPFGNLDAQLTSRDGPRDRRGLHVGDSAGRHRDRWRHPTGRGQPPNRHAWPHRALSARVSCTRS